MELESVLVLAEGVDVSECKVCMAIEFDQNVRPGRHSVAMDRSSGCEYPADDVQQAEGHAEYDASEHVDASLQC